MRTSAESAVATATKSLNTGDVQSTLKALGKADEIIENLRRRV
jgi:flagellin-specific chaperone FliS